LGTVYSLCSAGSIFPAFFKKDANGGFRPGRSFFSEKIAGIFFSRSAGKCQKFRLRLAGIALDRRKKIAAMYDLIFSVSVLCLVILLLIFLLKRFHQPYLVAYVLAGVLLGGHSLQIFPDGEELTALGSLGILLLMFFLGMEIEVPDRRSLLIQPILAQGIKVMLSIFLSLIAGYVFHLNPGSMLLLTILLAFNSTAVVSELLRANRDRYRDIGKTLLNMLLLQDIMLAPILTLFQFTGKYAIVMPKLLLSFGACVLLFLLLMSIRNRNLYQLPFVRQMEQDHELQVFAGACICLGFALLASLGGLGGPTGAFAAGLYIGRTDAFRWLEAALKPFKVFFTALFFVALGLMADISFIKNHLNIVLETTLLILVVNSLLSALTFRALKYSWKDSIPAGSLLSQTGEFSLLACTLARNAGIIDPGLFKGCIAVIVLSLLLSTPWALAFRKIIGRPATPGKK
jgi:monovalent cation:H+ antiporter-2, CPA2 family